MPSGYTTINPVCFGVELRTPLHEHTRAKPAMDVPRILPAITTNPSSLPMALLALIYCTSQPDFRLRLRRRSFLYHKSLKLLCARVPGQNASVSRFNRTWTSGCRCGVRRNRMSLRSHSFCGVPAAGGAPWVEGSDLGGGNVSDPIGGGGVAGL
jgi:hypothetical protein